MTDTKTALTLEFDTYRSFVADQISTLLPETARQAAADGDTTALRHAYRRLGEAGLLAPAWPTSLGGAGLPPWSAVAAYEALADSGLPDTPHILGIQIVGRLLRYHSTGDNWDAALRGLARGELFACVLYTEPAAGSDLSNIVTTAERDGETLRLSGTKILNLFATEADVGLVLAREAAVVPSHRYAGLSLFLLDMHSSGVTTRAMRSLQDESFCEVRLRDCRVSSTDRIGPAGAAWSTLDAGLAAERTGLDHVARARRWLRAARRHPDLGPNAAPERWALLEARTDAVTAWSRSASIRAEEGPIRTADVADLKVAASEIARDVAWSAAAIDLSSLHTPDAKVLDSAIREAPGLCLSAGTSEMMFATMLSSLSEDWERELDPSAYALEPEFYPGIVDAVDPMGYTRAHPETTQDASREAQIARRLEETGILRLEASTDLGGLDLPLRYGVTVSQVLGAHFLEDPYCAAAAASTQSLRTCARLLAANAAAFREAWRYMEARRQFGAPLTAHTALVYPLLHDLVDLRVASRAVARRVDNASHAEDHTLFTLCAQLAVGSVGRLMNACGTQSMTDRSVLGTAYAYVLRTIQGHLKPGSVAPVSDRPEPRDNT